MQANWIEELEDCGLGINSLLPLDDAFGNSNT
jgi:hypothetical protein